MLELKERTERAKADAQKVLDAIKTFGEDDYVSGAVIRFDRTFDKETKSYVAIKSVDSICWLLVDIRSLFSWQKSWDALIEFAALSETALSIWYDSDLTLHIAP